MSKSSWILAASVSAAFLVLSLGVMAREGLGALWGALQVNAWAPQVFLDLVLAAVTALVLAAPRAHRVGIRMAPWVILTLLTGSIGLLALVARIFYLEGRTKVAAGSDGGRAVGAAAS